MDEQHSGCMVNAAAGDKFQSRLLCMLAPDIVRQRVLHRGHREARVKSRNTKQKKRLCWTWYRAILGPLNVAVAESALKDWYTIKYVMRLPKQQASSTAWPLSLSRRYFAGQVFLNRLLHVPAENGLQQAEAVVNFSPALPLPMEIPCVILTA
ncbi:hypothetical protein TNCV_2759551 [Trichonephila clavipes]|nr:hypothetical protein TNCV_2759551 [Trichonephila clavipes]